MDFKETDNELPDAVDIWFDKNSYLFQSKFLAIRSMIPSFATAVEISIGRGRFAPFFNIGYGAELDISGSTVEMVRCNDVEINTDKSARLPFKNDTFDLVLMITTDCFLNNPLEFFKHIYRILKEGKHFIIGFLDGASTMGEAHQKSINEDERYAGIKLHTAFEIAALLETSGFEIIESRQTIFSLENVFQKSEENTGDGLFAIIKAKKTSSIYLTNKNKVK